MVIRQLYFYVTYYLETLYQECAVTLSNYTDRPNMLRKLILFLIFLCSIPTQPHGAEVKLATLEWEPYIYKNSDQGYVSQIIKMAFANSEYEIENIFFPWARAVYMAKKSDFAGYYPEYYSKEKTDDFYFSEPFPAAPLVLFKRKTDMIEYSNLQDLRNYSIAVVRGYVNTEEFDRATFLKKEETTSDLQNLKKLVSGRVNLAVIDKYVGYYLMEKYLPEGLSLIDTVTTPLAEKELHLCISKQHPEALKIMAAFNKGLQAMRENGSLEHLTQRFFLQFPPPKRKGE